MPVSKIAINLGMCGSNATS